MTDTDRQTDRQTDITDALDVPLHGTPNSL